MNVLIQWLQLNWSLIKQNFDIILWVIAILGVSIDLTPWIKVNPVRWIFNKINGFISRWIKGILDDTLSDIRENLEEQDKKINMLAEDINDISVRFYASEEEKFSKDLEETRWKILDFGNALRCKRDYNKEAYDYIIRLHNDYDKTIRAKHLENGQMDVTFAFIMEKYMYHMKNNDFL